MPRVIFLALLFACASPPAGSERPRWIDADRDCQSARDEVLIRDSLAPVGLDDKECHVRSGLWADRYSGRWTTDPSELDIDHVVPLEYARHARSWTKADFSAFANDLDDPAHLWAVSASENRRKGARGPSAYWPPNPYAHCAYAAAWSRIAEKWRLELRPEDAAALAVVRDRCGKDARALVAVP
jgi:hypothetical protein